MKNLILNKYILIHSDRKYDRPIKLFTLGQKYEFSTNFFSFKNGFLLLYLIKIFENLLHYGKIFPWKTCGSISNSNSKNL
jgi:hypothetical protein